MMKVIDVVLLLVILAVSIWMIFRSMSASGDRIVVHAADRMYEFSLKEDGSYKIPGPLGETTVQVKNGRARIVESPCPNKICIRQGFAKPLVCLPNKIIVDVEDSEGFDAVAR
ncbi:MULTISPECIES: NusG domain II-containing protein [unclassified Fibrobacter]|uniref:NusG domain II-containing protein n=1 Tax=unclassified Fibrobacter TaxID=2634177 RepID=UPI000D6CA827|nr:MULTISPECIES: NusG domain II-containing protein [unclassified Fibrobacter]MCQ2123846.1 NusG domain II-containing protein [Fibrobacter sp.]PWJ57502.1 hypothetical protein BGX12_1541 [Fibrobacter sp. UWR4]PZW61296.1 hypothetical protein C8E88_10893 [Fibrobacter sp. UWR1]